MQNIIHVRGSLLQVVLCIKDALSMRLLEIINASASIHERKSLFIYKKKRTEVPWSSKLHRAKFQQMHK